MALNFTVSYTFSPSTTISSSQVNTNTNDVASVFQGLEAETKTLAKLKMDADPTIALEVATKQYVDHYSAYRRPVLQYSSTTAVNMEAGINGTSGQAQILFPDGNLRTDSTGSRINLDITRNAVLSGSAQSGLRTSSAAANTWYACYAVKVSDSTTNFVMVADTVFPIQANYSTLNSNFGTNSWVYLGLIRYGDRSGATTSILEFTQWGGLTQFRHSCTGVSMTGQVVCGFSIANGTSGTLTYSYSAGSGTAQIPNNITHIKWIIGDSPGGGEDFRIKDSGAVRIYAEIYSNANVLLIPLTIPASEGVSIVASAAVAKDFFVNGFYDGVLGIGSNPLL